MYVTAELLLPHNISSNCCWFDVWVCVLRNKVKLPKCNKTNKAKMSHERGTGEHGGTERKSEK